jgi:hypothetical protein
MVGNKQIFENLERDPSLHIIRPKHGVDGPCVVEHSLSVSSTLNTKEIIGAELTAKKYGVQFYPKEFPLIGGMEWERKENRHVCGVECHEDKIAEMRLKVKKAADEISEQLRINKLKNNHSMPIKV